ncbi:hypothetical protein BGW42_005997 [Actinomortierella wolfii]|nr:hypothetical protein BGW42_005997 [Actinomortierella wolfii]KAG0229509.1 hypothetical protein BGW41_003019 [Actinomortierella wolfii]
MLFDHHDKVLDVTVHSADKLQRIDWLDRNDPYVRLFLDLNRVEDGTLTHTVEGGGKQPVWNQTVSLKHLKDTTKYLYLEIMDEDTKIDELIAYAAIPLDQVTSAPNHRYAGKFNVFSRDGKAHGNITLTLRIRKINEQPHEAKVEESTLVKGVSQSEAEHEKRIQRILHRERYGESTATTTTTKTVEHEKVKKEA